jgi:hypothetical protein
VQSATSNSRDSGGFQMANSTFKTSTEATTLVANAPAESFAIYSLLERPQARNSGTAAPGPNRIRYPVGPPDSRQRPRNVLFSKEPGQDGLWSLC